MASPGSTAPSAPRYGLDYGYGDVQDLEQVQRWKDLGESDALIQSRLSAGLNNTGWGGPAPTVARGDADGMWNYSTPLSSSATPTWAAQKPASEIFGAQQYANNLAGQGNYGQSGGSGAAGASTAPGTTPITPIAPNTGSLPPAVAATAPPKPPTPPPGQNINDMDPMMLLSFLSQLLGPQGLAALFGNPGQSQGQGQGAGGQATQPQPFQRQPPLTNGRNLSLMRNYFYPQSEPVY
jgi:hypothetical protein